MVQTCLDKILIEKDKKGAVNYCKGMISDLLMNKIDLSLLVITKSLGKKTEADNDSKKAKGKDANPTKGYTNK